MNRIHYYKVTAKCGHVGAGNYVDKDFAVIAECAKEASQKAKQFPRVKKQLKSSITSCKEIDVDEFHEIINKNSNDPYFLIKSKREQKQQSILLTIDVKMVERIPVKSKVNNYEFKRKKEFEYIRSLLNTPYEECSYA